MLAGDEFDLEAQEQDYRDDLRALTLSRLETALLLVVFIVVLDGGVQWLVRPDLFRELLWTRVTTVLASLLLLAGRFELQDRGVISVKGKGDMQVFLLTGRSR